MRHVPWNRRAPATISPWILACGLLLGDSLARPASACADLVQPGDLAFIGWNADGDDDLAFALLADTTPATVVWFSDNEWQGTALNSGEGTMKWTAGTSLLAGTVVVLRDIDATANPLHGASSGTLTGALQLATGGDTVYAYLGNSLGVPTTFLAAISTRAGDYSGSGGTLVGTGLSTGATAVLLPEGSRGGQYVGGRADLPSLAEYGARIVDSQNWQLQTSDGEAGLPFNTATFTAQSTATPEPGSFLTAAAVAGVWLVQQLRRRRGTTRITGTEE